jgi:hypothetical protein
MAGEPEALTVPEVRPEQPALVREEQRAPGVPGE